MPPPAHSKSEIDDIFGGKSTATTSRLPSEPQAAQQKADELNKKKIRRDKSRAQQNTTKGSSTASETAGRNSSSRELTSSKGKEKAGEDGLVKEKSAQKRKRPKEVQQVLDPSMSASDANGSSESKSKSQKSQRKELNEEDERFRDSRGSKRNKTEEGWAIFTEAELKINSESGGTQLCPFDCDCCF